MFKTRHRKPSQMSQVNKTAQILSDRIQLDFLIVKELALPHLLETSNAALNWN